EEEPQQRLVACLDPGLAPVEPVAQRLPPRGREPVLAARTPAARRVLAGDPTRLLEPAQLGVDLPVARGPEVPDRFVDDPLDVVARTRAESQQPEHDPRHRIRLHVSKRYIAVQQKYSAE